MSQKQQDDSPLENIESNAVIYMRVSTSEQARRGGEAEGFSIPVQRERGRVRAKELNAVTSMEFTDAGRSGTNMNRPGLQAMLECVSQNRPTYVIVYKLDRLARNLLDSLIIRRQLEAVGTRLVSCTEHFDSSPAGELTLNFMGSVNQYYSSNLTEEMKSKLIG